MHAAFLPLIANVALPPLRGSQWLSTGLDFEPVILVLGALALYLWGVKRVNRLQPRHRWSVGKTAAFAGGLAATSIAIFTAIGVYDSELFWVHMVQHLLLIMVAAPLFAIASPIDLAWRATTGPARPWAKRLLRSGPARFGGHPAIAFVLYALVIPITHLTAWYNYTLTHEVAHNMEHLIFLVVGYFFWRQIFGSDPNCYRMHPALQFAYLFLAIPVDTFTGISLTNTAHEIFPAYFSLHRTWGPSLVQDLHLGGVVMWIGGDTLMLWPMIPVAVRWVRQDERRALRVDEELDRMMPSGPSAPLR